MKQFDDQEIFMLLNSGIKMVEKGEDFYIYWNDIKCKHFYNCKDVSRDFLNDTFEIYKELIGEEGYDEVTYEDIDLRELLEQSIRDGAWDWRKEVKEYKGY